MLLSCLYDLLPSVLKSSKTEYEPPCTSSLPSPRIPHLPLEVVIHILEETYHSEPNPTQLLLNCSLVCRDWSFLAQPLLFRNVTLASQTAYDSFLGAANRTTPRGSMLSDAVIRMKVVLDANQPFGLSQACFTTAVNACPNLCELEVAIYGHSDQTRQQLAPPFFDDTTLDALRTGPRIKSLHFNNSADDEAAIFPLLDVWPCLKSLAISGTPPKLPSTTLHASFPTAIEELRINCQSAVSIDFMKWLLHNSVHSLHTLELEREQPMIVVDYVVETHGAKLRSLAIPACTTHDMATAVKKCVGLDELRIEHPWVTPVLFKPLPEKLTRLAIALDQDSAVQPWLDFVRKSETLKELTVQVWGSNEQHMQLPALAMACAFRGVVLEMTQDIKIFRSVVRRDPTTPSPFTRKAPIEE
ncbi:F-box domain-containing protein [Mycena indigotica]|uniref:F-box domain-containing protein n=1 Tax=Mycena indigotica TaxID=2126181 RepID=A0A8H6SVY5_9AGAR|nr:F-box domain-containing protein [Mycena indigotica]KAF7307220.1 F-box domain-containing protein [Mycena indigotica]